MTTDVPASVAADALSMQGDGKVDLFEIQLVDGAIVYFHNANEVTWRGNTYTSNPIKISGVGDNADEQVARPTLIVGNPDGIFNPFVTQGLVEHAIVRRRRLLRKHLEGNQDIKATRSWRISRIVSLTTEAITCELRNPLDGPLALVPRRMYIPPEFPVVSL